MERTEDNEMENDDRQYIPYEIVSQEIFSRLPVKTIFRFRSACKLWCLLPYDNKLIEMHLNRSHDASSVIIMSNKKVGTRSIISFFSLYMGENGFRTKHVFTITLLRDAYEMEPSTHGLVLFSSLLGHHIYLCNPSTHEFVQLPKVSDTGAFYPCKVAGFGFDQVTRKFKVLCASNRVKDDTRKCFIFTLGSADGKWRQVDDISYRIAPTQNAYFNGMVYWIIKSRTHYGPDGILSFRFEDEKYQVLPLPTCTPWTHYEESWGVGSNVCLKVLAGCLRLIVTFDASHAGYWSLDIWTLKNYTDHVWACEFEVVSDDMPCNCMRFELPAPVDIRDGKVYFSIGGRLFIFDVKTKISWVIMCGFPGENEMNTLKKYQPNYGESLVLINGN